MRIIAVDDEQPALEKIVMQLSEITNEVKGFSNPNEALEYVKNNAVDVAFLDIEMYGMDGLELARQVKMASPATSVIFLTGHSHYAVDAFKVKAQGYLLKPASKEDIERELEEQTGGLKVQTFGNFEIFSDGTPVKFGRSKSKELLAYLIDRRGAAATMNEIITVLWENRQGDKNTQSLLRNIISDLTLSLKSASAENLLIKKRNSLSVNVDIIQCDYYDFLNGDMRAVNSFSGEYMTNYGWAEFRLGTLQKIVSDI